MTIPQGLNELSRVIVDAGFTVHARLGPGLLESVYETCLAYELKKGGWRWGGKLPFPSFTTSFVFPMGFASTCWSKVPL